MSDINSRVLKRLVDMKIAPSRLSTPSAIFLPVQLIFSYETAVFVNGGAHVFGSGSLVRIYFLSSRSIPILNKNIFVTKESFNLATLDSDALSSSSKWS